MLRVLADGQPDHQSEKELLAFQDMVHAWRAEVDGHFLRSRHDFDKCWIAMPGTSEFDILSILVPSLLSLSFMVQVSLFHGRSAQIRSDKIF